MLKMCYIQIRLNIIKFRVGGGEGKITEKQLNILAVNWNLIYTQHCKWYIEINCTEQV